MLNGKTTDRGINNKTKNFPVTVHDVDVTQKVRGKYIYALKGKTTRRKTNVVDRDQVKITLELMKIHKEVFMTCSIFCEQDSIISDYKSENLFHGYQ